MGASEYKGVYALDEYPYGMDGGVLAWRRPRRVKQTLASELAVPQTRANEIHPSEKPLLGRSYYNLVLPVVIPKPRPIAGG